MTDLHERLIAKQPTDELKRKAGKSRERANIWTQEELDYAARRGEELARSLKWA